MVSPAKDAPSAVTSVAVIARRINASKHNAATGHPVITSFEPRERWFYDYHTGEFFAGPNFPILSHIIQINPCPGQLVAYPQIGKRFFMSDRLGLRSGDQPKRLEPLMAERSVLITGCSSGIGLCAAQTLRARGWRLRHGAAA